MRVITDDRRYKLWAVAALRDEAIDRVLDAIPEGWVAAFYDGGERGNRILEVLNLEPGEVREITAKAD